MAQSTAVTVFLHIISFIAVWFIYSWVSYKAWNSAVVPALADARPITWEQAMIFSIFMASIHAASVASGVMSASLISVLKIQGR